MNSTFPNFYFQLAVIAFSSVQLLSCASKPELTAKSPTLALQKVRELTLGKTPRSSTNSAITAASGIVKKGSEFFLVSDNEKFLFSMNLNQPHLKSFPLLNSKTKNKTTSIDFSNTQNESKPDFESVAWLTPSEWPPYGAIVAWPSASKPEYTKAVVVPFYMDSSFGTPIVSDISPLAKRFIADVKALNMEGFTVRDKKVFIFQRGNRPQGQNGILEMPLALWIRGIKTGDWSGSYKFDPIQIGTLNGVSLSFSDADWTRYGWLALATAESSDSKGSNGTVYGTVLVRIAEGKAHILSKFEPGLKLEGLVAEPTVQGLDLYLVDDSDKAEPSALYKTHLNTQELQLEKSLE